MSEHQPLSGVVNTVCMQCFQVCGIKAHIKEGKLIKVEGWPGHPFSAGVICPRGQSLLSSTRNEYRWPGEEPIFK